MDVWVHHIIFVSHTTLPNYIVRSKNLSLQSQLIPRKTNRTKSTTAARSSKPKTIDLAAAARTRTHRFFNVVYASACAFIVVANDRDRIPGIYQVYNNPLLYQNDWQTQVTLVCILCVYKASKYSI